LTRNVLFRRFYQVPHFWLILVIMILGALVYYADQLPIFQKIVTLIPFEFARYSTYRMLSIIPVAYAAFVFRWQGGVVSAVLICLALMPRAIFFSAQSSEAIIETIAFFFIGLLVTWLIHRQQYTVHQLEDAQQKLQADVQIIKDNEKRLAALDQISSTVSESLNLNTIMGNAIDNVVDVMKADVAWIFLLDEKNSELSLAAHRGTSEELAQGVDRLKLGEGFNGRVAQSGQPLFVEDASQDPRLTREVVSAFKLRSTLIVPISSKGKVNGTLCIAMYDYRRFQPEEVDLLTAIGNQIGIAVENAHLYQQQQVIAQQLGISEERYRGLFENSSDAIFLCSNAARIISTNKACEQLTGYTQEQLASTAIYNLFSGVSQDKVRQLFSEKLERVTVGITEDVRLTRKNGSDAFVELKISPLLRGNEVIGLQFIANDVTEERLLHQNMEYYIKQVTKAQEDERLRISRELHDDTAQVLATLSRGLDSLIMEERKLKKPVVERLEKLHEMADSALEGVRRFSQDLRPSILDDLGLVPALEWLTTDLEKGYGIGTKFNVSGSQKRLTAEIELTVFRIAQEVLSNIRRHSQATAVEMTLDYNTDALTLAISDNGQGFDMPERTSDLALSGKLGIIGMRERARLVGGTLVVRTGSGAGTTVALRIPI
jgi:two-component system sensor histidine kinase DegS